VTVTGLVADADSVGHVRAIIAACLAPGWRGFWEDLAIPVLTFDDLGLKLAAPDAEVWAACQARGLVLITGNRNAAGLDSLEQTIRTRGTLTSLPVLTLTDRDRLLRDRAYAERAAARLIEILMGIEGARGTGRLYLP
jgi:hypothetical protein